MKIAIIGATGFIGQPIFNEAVARNHKVTALVRNPDNLVTSEQVTAQKVDVKNSVELVAALADQDAAVVSLHYEDQYLPGLINALKDSKIKYVLFVGGAASLEVAPGVELLDTPNFPEEWKLTARAAKNLLTALKTETELNWTYLSPSAFIESGKRTGIFRLGRDQLVMDEKGDSKISTQDFAVAVIDELEKPVHKQQRFTVGY